MTYSSEIELGAIYRDSITKFEGVAISVTRFLYACERVALQPIKMHEGKPIDAHYFDAHQLELVKPASKSPAKPPQLLLEDFLEPDDVPTRRVPGGPGGTEAKQNTCPVRSTRR